MANPYILKYGPEKLYAEWPIFERWSAALTAAQVFSSGVATYELTQAGGLQGDPVLNLPSISQNYKDIELKINAAFTLQGTNGVTTWPLKVTNNRCGWPSSGATGIIVNGAISQFSFTGNHGKLILNDMPSNIDMSALWFQYALDQSYNYTTWGTSAGNYYLLAAFQVSLHGRN